MKYILVMSPNGTYYNQIEWITLGEVTQNWTLVISTWNIQLFSLPDSNATPIDSLEIQAYNRFIFVERHLCVIVLIFNQLFPCRSECITHLGSLPTTVPQTTI